MRLLHVAHTVQHSKCTKPSVCSSQPGTKPSSLPQMSSGSVNFLCDHYNTATRPDFNPQVFSTMVLILRHLFPTLTLDSASHGCLLPGYLSLSFSHPLPWISSTRVLVLHSLFSLQSVRSAQGKLSTHHLRVDQGALAGGVHSLVGSGLHSNGSETHQLELHAGLELLQ